MKRIRKNYSGVVPNGKIFNTKNNSLEDTYSCNYLNDNIPVVDNMGSIVVDDIECKNILPNNSYSTVMGGVTITRNADGSITFNGTASSTFNYYLLSGYHFKLKAGIYTLSLHKNGEISGTALLSLFNQSDVATLISNMNLATNNSITATTENDLDLKSLLLYVVVGCTFNNFTIYPMLEKGSKVSDYVPNKEFSNLQNYSTEEQVIGTWIDGKPLYRRVLETANYLTTGEYTVLDNSFNLEIVTIYGWILKPSTGYIVPYGSFMNTASSYTCRVFFDGTNVKVQQNTNYQDGTFKARVIIEYTKKTD